MLQIWLPLNGHLNNQGLNSTNGTWVGSSSYDNNGKIGKCVSCNSSHYVICPYNFQSTNKFSQTFWIYIPSTLGNCGQWETVYSINGYLINWASYNNLKIYDNSNNQLWWLSSDIFYDKWVHLAIVHTGNTIQLYINGLLYGESTSNSSPISSGTIYLGSGIDTTYGPVKFCDYRLYDSVLSPKQVHEIAKGLVLHYPMNDSSINNNLIVGSTVFNYASCSSDITVERLENNSILKITTSSSSNGNWVRWQPGNESATNINMSVIPIETPITVSCDILIESGSGIPTLFINQSYRSFIGNSNLIGQWQRVYYTYNYDGQTVSYNYFTPHFGVNGKLGSWKIKNPKIEIGSNNNPIWTENNQNQDIYDCSGYCNNGTVTGSLQVVDDSPRYKQSTKITTSNTIKTTVPVLNNIYTFSWWYNKADFSAGDMMWGYANGNRINPLYNLCFNVSDGSSSPWYVPGTTTKIKAPSGNTWHHFVITGDGNASKLYIDGLYYGKCINFKSITGSILHINGWSSGGDYRTNGKISDFRIYSTALSDDDIKELYNTSAIINNNNTLSAYEFVE